MSNQLIIPNGFGAISAVAQQYAQNIADDELSGGISSGFAVLSYKGKVWRIKHRGEERALMQDDGVSPRSSIEVVIIKANPHLSKIFYQNGYVEGSTDAPDCFSTNGVAPDSSSKARQANACAGCAHNAWGSRITPQGKSGKACQDSKRLAVVPVADIDNEVFGGPMLLRVPAASLNDLATFSKTMKGLGYPYFAIATRISFDINEAYPKFVFGAIRPLNDQEAAKIIALRDDENVGRILAEAVENAEPGPAPDAVAAAFEQPPAPPASQPLSAQVAAAAAARRPGGPATVVTHNGAPVTQPGNAQSMVGAAQNQPVQVDLEEAIEASYVDVQPQPAPAPKPAPRKAAAPKPAPAPTPAPVETQAYAEETGSEDGGAPSDFEDMLDGLLNS